MGSTSSCRQSCCSCSTADAEGRAGRRGSCFHRTSNALSLHPVPPSARYRHFCSALGSLHCLVSAGVSSLLGELSRRQGPRAGQGEKKCRDTTRGEEVRSTNLGRCTCGQQARAQMSPPCVYSVPSRSPQIPQSQYQEAFGREVSPSRLNPVRTSSERKDNGSWLGWNRAEQSRTEQSRAEQNRAGQSRAEQSRVFLLEGR